MSSGIPTAKAQLAMELDGILTRVRQVDRLVVQESSPNTAWVERNRTLLQEMYEAIEDWRERLA